MQRNLKALERQIAALEEDLSIERRKTERALSESEEKFRKAFDANPSIMAISRYSDETFVMINSSFVRITGYSREEAIGKTPSQLNLWANRENREVLKKKMLSAGESILNAEVPFRTKSGEIRIGLASAEIMEIGGEKHILSLAHDITERKLAEEALRKSEDKFAKAFRSSPVAMSIHSFPELRFLTVNDKFGEMTGFAANDVTGKCGIDIGMFEDSRVLDEIRERLRESGSIRNMQLPFKTKDGQIREGLFALELMELDAKESVLISVLDISESLKIQEDRIKADKLESVGILAGGIAHDFNNILMAILGNISLVKMEPGLNEDAIAWLTESENAVMRAKNLTQQLLTFARGGSPVITTVSLRELLPDATEFALRGSNVRGIFEISDDLMPAEVDTAQVSQVIQNIVINAIQSMPGGGFITVRARNALPGEFPTAHSKSGKYLRIEIQDQGSGISKEHMPKIFDPYFTTKQKGSGLGLATAYSIIKNHYGSIAAESASGNGTTFIIHLPASDKALPPPAKKPESVFAGRGRILIMDDEEAIRKLAEVMLTRSGYEVTLVADGKDAVTEYKASIIEGKKYDAVIMDLTIPGGMGGKEAIARLLDLDPGIKAVVSSGYSTDPIMSRYGDYGFSAVIAKPYRMSALTECIARLLENDA